MTIGELIKQYRSTHDISQRRFAIMCNLSNGYISMLENGANPKTGQPLTPTLPVLQQLATGMGLSLTSLLSIVDDMPVDLTLDQKEPGIPEGFSPLPETSTIPHIGQVACGEPITAEENLDGYTAVPSSWSATFTLTCRGDSMAPRILDGDLVAIRKQDTVENGQIAAVRIGDEATLKHVYVYPSYIELRPENPAFESIIKIGPDMADVHIEGIAVGLCRGL